MSVWKNVSGLPISFREDGFAADSVVNVEPDATFTISDKLDAAVVGKQVAESQVEKVNTATGKTFAEEARLAAAPETPATAPKAAPAKADAATDKAAG